MSDAKTYVFGQDSNYMNWLAPLLQQKGIDPSVLAMMNNGGFGNGNWIWVFFLILLFGRNGLSGSIPEAATITGSEALKTQK